MASRQRGETMGSTESKRPSVTVEAPEKALSGLGEPITEEQAKAIAALEDCKCKAGMFALAVTRRQLLAGSGLLAAVGMPTTLPSPANAKAQPCADEYPVHRVPTTEQVRMVGLARGY